MVIEFPTPDRKVMDFKEGCCEAIREFFSVKYDQLQELFESKNLDKQSMDELDRIEHRLLILDGVANLLIN